MEAVLQDSKHVKHHMIQISKFQTMWFPCTRTTCDAPEGMAYDCEACFVCPQNSESFLLVFAMRRIFFSGADRGKKNSPAMPKSPPAVARSSLRPYRPGGGQRWALLPCPAALPPRHPHTPTGKTAAARYGVSGQATLRQWPPASAVRSGLDGESSQLLPT